jgi:ABC-type transport system substrate-binding protein
MDANYWTRVTRARLSRRRALTATGGAAAAAAFLAACGGDDDDGGSGTAESDLLIKPTEQTASRKRGGTLNIAANVANATLEQALAGNGSGTPLSQSVYSQLMRMKMGIYPEIPEQNPEPEFAQSVEMSGDGLTATFKLRRMKFDDRAPTNSRVSTSEDVKYSWERWESGNVRAPELSNNKHADAPVTRVTTPDDQTAVFHLAFPFAPFLAYLTSQHFPFIYPREANGGFDTRAIARGTGPWLLPDVRPAGDAVMDRNPNYYHAGEPYFDRLHVHAITEYSTIRTQFEAGALDFHNALLQEDVLALKKRDRNLLLYQRPFFNKGSGGVFFGRRPGSPWNDDRVRKALAMNMDAGLWGDNFSNRAKFEAEGLPVDVKWFARAGPGYSWYLDPEKNELGDVSKYLHHNPSEAHKLLQATGMDLPIRSTYQVSVMSNELYDGMIGLYQSSGDFKFDVNVVPDANQFLSTVRNVGGNFDGFGIAFYFDHMDYDWTMYLAYHPSSTDFWMGVQNEDPKMTDFVRRQRRELDSTKREQIFQDFVKYDIGQMYYMPYHYPANWLPYYVAQPWMGGWGWWQPYIEQYPFGAGQIHSQYWFDASKKPA